MTRNLCYLTMPLTNAHCSTHSVRSWPVLLLSWTFWLLAQVQSPQHVLILGDSMSASAVSPVSWRLGYLTSSSSVTDSRVTPWNLSSLKTEHSLKTVIADTSLLFFQLTSSNTLTFKIPHSNRDPQRTDLSTSLSSLSPTTCCSSLAPLNFKVNCFNHYSE